MKGLPHVVAERLRQRLERKYVDHHASDPYTLAEMFESLEWLYNGGMSVFGRGEDEGMRGRGGEERQEGGSAVVKMEKVEIAALAEAIKGMSSMLAMMGQIGQQQASYGGGRVPQVQPQTAIAVSPAPLPTIRPMNVPGGFPPPPRPGCRFCDRADHYIRSCPVVDEYIAAGKCIRNISGQVTLPNGAFLPRYAQGGSLKEGFDNFYGAAAARATPVTIQATMFEANDSDYPVHEAYHDGGSGVHTMMWTVDEREEPVVAEVLQMEAADEEEWEYERLMVLAAEAKKRVEKKKAERFDGVQVPAAKGPPGIPASQVTPAGVKKVTAKELAAKKMTPVPLVARPAAKAVPVSENVDSAQYRFQTPAEDKQLLKSVLERSLEGSVVVTQRELLAISPEARKHMKELTTTKRVLVGSAEVYFHETEPGVLAAEISDSWKVINDGTILVAKDTLPLRCIDALVEGKLMVECVIDPGSQIVAMRKEIWEQLGLPLMSDYTMVMETANKSRTTTMGLLQNLKLTFGGIDLILQVQVIDKAPFDVLLGRPFQALASCQTNDFRDGEQHIRISDPNSDRVVTIPTRDRRLKPKSIGEGGAGFVGAWEGAEREEEGWRGGGEG